MCGREKDKDKSSSIICHLLSAVVEKDNVWERERLNVRERERSCSGRERQCVGERKIKTRVAQLFVTYRLQW